MLLVRVCERVESEREISSTFCLWAQPRATDH